MQAIDYAVAYCPVRKGENEDFGGVEGFAELSVVEMFFAFELDIIFSGRLEELIYCVFPRGR